MSGMPQSAAQALFGCRRIAGIKQELAAHAMQFGKVAALGTFFGMGKGLIDSFESLGMSAGVAQGLAKKSKEGGTHQACGDGALLFQAALQLVDALRGVAAQMQRLAVAGRARAMYPTLCYTKARVLP